MDDLYSTEEFEAKYTYSGNDLGAVWQENQTAFRVWAPTAQGVEVCLFSTGCEWDDSFITSFSMFPSENGTWLRNVEGDLNGIYYTYCVHHDNWTVNTCDPYAHAVGVNGKRAMVVNMDDTNPLDWRNDAPPHKSLPFVDWSIYELHIRDVSMGPGAGITHKGKYLGLTEYGTKSRQKLPTGLDYIKRLGISHIHFLPFYDFGSIDETDLQSTKFNWGYDPVDYNAPEGSYSTNPYDGFCRIRELKQMIQTLHQNGIGVIMDVVYNHVYHRDGFCFNQIVPGYFSRTNKLGKYSNGSGCGNDTASERSMVRKFIVDSVKFWAEEYHIDGFRFDIVGLLDVTTIQECINAVHATRPWVKFYGEGWDIPTNTVKENVTLATQKNAYLLPEMAFFNDTILDAMKGPFCDAAVAGFAAGAAVSKEHLLNCFSGRTYWSDQPSQIINYISCHDDHTLYDRIAIAKPNDTAYELARRNRLAAAFNILSMEIPFFQAGEEMLRSKRSRSGKIISNSYHSTDSINALKWNSLADSNVLTTVQYYRGLLDLRRSHALFRMQQPFEIRNSIYPQDIEGDATAAFRLISGSEQIIAAWNAEQHPVNLKLPKGIWSVRVMENNAGDVELARITESFELAPLSAVVLIQER